MRNPPRFAMVPLAVLVSIVPFTFSSFVGPAGADSVADCQEAFSSPTAGQLVYTTDPPTRLAYSGQTVSLSAGWDPAAWDSLSSAVACVRLDDDTFAEALGTSEASPANGGAFGHSFIIPEVAAGTRLCTKIRLAGDPAGEATDATWVSKMHCFEVDHDLEEEAPPDDTTQPPATTTSTIPTASPATSEAPPGDTPAAEIPASPPLSSEGGGAPVGAPFDSPATPAGGPDVPGAPTTPEALPLLPATGYASPWLLHQGAGLLLIGLGLLVLSGRPRWRRRQTA
ncbi:MAG: hypothetical protein ACRDYF_09945 [Acidimicrobiia bacterium]